MTTNSHVSRLVYTAAVSTGLFLAACSGEPCSSPDASASVAPASQSVGVDPGPMSVAPVDSPDGTVTAAIAALREKKVSGFLQLVAPPEAMKEMKSQWEAKRKEPLPEGSDQEFQSFMGMVTAEGAEEMLFGMARPYLKDAQEQVNGLAMMMPMMAAGALQEAGAPDEAGAAVGALAQKLQSLNVADEDKAKEAIAILCSSMRQLDLNSTAEIQALEFNEVMSRVDVLYGGVIDILGVYDLSPQETLESMQVKLVSAEGDLAQLEMTFSLFGMEPQTVPFEMERLEGRWFPKEPEASSEDEVGTDVAR